jgi:hypothetical protein
MGLAPFYGNQVDVIDADLIALPVTKVKKQLWDEETQTFIPRVFVRYRCDNAAQYDNGHDWLKGIYGPGKLYADWWAGPRHHEIWMDEKIYTFWRLRLGYES